MGRARTGAYVSVIFAMIFWGFTFVLFKFANESFRPITIAFLRLFISIFFLFGFAILLKRLKKIKPKDQKWLILLAFLEPFLYFLGEAHGLTMVSATVGSVLISTIPLIVPFGAYYFGGVPTDPRGVLLMFVAVFSAVGYTLVVKKLVDDYNPITITAYQSFYGLLMFIPLFVFVELPRLDWSIVTTQSLLSLLYLGVFGSGICFILIATGIRELGAARANIFGNLIPVVTAVLAFLLLKEPMPLIKVLGILVAIAGLLMSQVSSINWKSPAKKGGLRHPPYS
jgi:drug/metabolite transporter (DMT)-like permease